MTQRRAWGKSVGLALLLIVLMSTFTACGSEATPTTGADGRTVEAARVTAAAGMSALTTTTAVTQVSDGTGEIARAGCLEPVSGAVSLVQACMSDEFPRQDTNVTVYGRLIVAGRVVPDAKMETLWDFKYLPSGCKGVATGANGVASCTKDIKNATRGYRVAVAVTFSHEGKDYKGSTNFTTEGTAGAVSTSVAAATAATSTTLTLPTTTTAVEAATATATPTATLAPVLPTATATVTVTAAPTPTPVPPTATAISATATTIPTQVVATVAVPVSQVRFLAVNGTSPGRTASVEVQASPGANCSIIYFVPSGRVSTAKGLDNKLADGSGRVAWSWLISGNTGRGTGSVSVTCNGVTVRSPIVIG